MDCALLVLRVVAGIIFLIHGWGKVFGSGPAAVGMAGFTGFLTSLGVPAAGLAAWVVGLLELLGGLGLILGVFVMPLAALLAVEMLVAFLLASKGRLPKGDLELALFGITLALALAGSGAYALLQGGKKRMDGGAPPPM